MENESLIGGPFFKHMFSLFMYIYVRLHHGCRVFTQWIFTPTPTSKAPLCAGPTKSIPPFEPPLPNLPRPLPHRSLLSLFFFLGGGRARGNVFQILCQLPTQIISI